MLRRVLTAIDSDRQDSNKILFLSDTKTYFAKQIGWTAGVGDRNGRWAMIIEKDGTVSYAEKEQSPRDVTVSAALTRSLFEQLLLSHHAQVSGAEAILSKL